MKRMADGRWRKRDTPYKIVMSPEVRKKFDQFSPKERKQMEQAMRCISRDPFGPHTLQIGAEPTPEALLNWMGPDWQDEDMSASKVVDLIMEYLASSDCLNDRGRTFATTMYRVAWQGLKVKRNK